jgi:hypothetical protein
MAYSDPLLTPGIQRRLKPYFEDEYATILLDDSIPAVTVTMRGIPKSSEHYQLVQRKRLELMNLEVKNYPQLHMLTDSRTAGPVLDEDVDYFKSQVLPQMERAGIRYLAIVMPNNKFTQLTIKDMTSEVKIMRIRYFGSMREARFWLRKMTVA